MIHRFRSGPIRYWRGRHLYEVSHAYEGEGFIGLRDGRIIAQAPEPAVVARMMIEAGDILPASTQPI